MNLPHYALISFCQPPSIHSFLPADAESAYQRHLLRGYALPDIVEKCLRLAHSSVQKYTAEIKFTLNSGNDLRRANNR
jgi:hypothetical protein